MADSKHLESKDLTQCGICLSTMEDPKALPCLHSYCLGCLTRWAEGRKDVVKCPICCQDFALPKEGVKGYRTNFLINNLKERKYTSRKLKFEKAITPCNCCGATDKKAVAYCCSCVGFVCADCVDLHDKVASKCAHTVIPLEDLRSGKVDMQNISQQKFCKFHKGQVLWLYCETCGILICRDCTVLDHPAPSHVLDDLENATKGQKREIDQLTFECRFVQEKVDGDLKKISSVLRDLEENSSKTDEKIDATFDDYKNHLLKMLEEKRSTIKAEARQEVRQRKKQLEDQKEDMQHQQTRFHTALQMAAEVAHSGSDHDLAVAFSSLKSSMSQLRDIERISVDRNRGKIDFQQHKFDQPSMPKLGTLVYKQKGEVAWELEKDFGREGKGKLTNGRGIAVASDGDIVVANMTGYKGFIVYNEIGQFKRNIDTNHHLKRNESACPYGVAASSDGRIVITQKTSQVHVYDERGTFLQQFPTISPDNVSSDGQNTQHMGIAIDNQGNLLVAEVTKRYISRHQIDGLHMKSFKVQMAVWYIAVSTHNKIVVSGNKNTPHQYEPCIHILNSSGKLLNYIRSPTVYAWNPHGVCCTDDDEVYISSYRDSMGIYRYSSETGSYLGCIITNDVNRPVGLAVSDKHDGKDRLLVAQEIGVKVFKLHDDSKQVTPCSDHIGKKLMGMSFNWASFK